MLVLAGFHVFQPNTRFNINLLHNLNNILIRIRERYSVQPIAGGLIQLNHGRPQPLQYVVNAAFLASLYSDYLDAADTPGWYCGPNFYSTGVLRDFARTQVHIFPQTICKMCNAFVFPSCKLFFLFVD